jgi:hypothetical protein
MRKLLLALTLLSIPLSSQAFAQQQRSGTAEEQKACTRDVQKFTILACLKEHRSKISTACDQVLKNNGQ